MTAEREACGLGSIIPMSCRGRAEAFARRLQSRLQTLGHGLGSASGMDDSSDESSWIGRNSGVTSCQPRLSSSTESDIYFDFDYESPGSPEEAAEVDLSEILVNQNVDQHNNSKPPILERDSGSLSLSAGDGNSGDSDSSDGPYFDSLASQSEEARLSRENSMRNKRSKKQNCHVLSSKSVHNQKDYSTCNGFTRHEVKHETQNIPEEFVSELNETNKTEELIDETKSCADVTHDDKITQSTAEDDKLCYRGSFAQMSEDSSDITSDYTTACDTESVDSTSVDSTSCSSIIMLASDEPPESLKCPAIDNEFADYVRRYSDDENCENDLDSQVPEFPQSKVTEDQEDNLTESLEEKLTESLNVSDVFSDHTYCASTEKSNDLVIECPPSSRDEVGLCLASEKEETVPLSAKENAENGINKTQKDEDDDDDDDDMRPRLQRSSSLKTGKTPPGTPGRKKIVRFADVLGLDLADVRTFLDEIPKIPSSAYDDLRDVDLSLSSDASPVNGTRISSGVPMIPAVPKPAKCLTPLFQQPGGQTDFLDRIRNDNVCLENAVVSDSVTFTITGTVRVRNLDFHKSVHIRYTIDSWNTYADHQATYIQNSCDGFSDKFSFVLYAHTLAVGQRLEFAIRFQCRGAQYWDSNRGANYVFQCLPPTSTSIQSLTLTSPLEDAWTSFY